MIYCRSSRYSILLMVLLGLLSHNLLAQTRTHVVVRGDTIFSLARLYKVGQEELMRQNGISDASRLLVGMRLVIPSGASSPPAPVSTAAYANYTVLPNDTLYSIARTRGITLQALCDMNGFSKNYLLKAGERIKIPNPAVVTPSISPVIQSASVPQPPLRVVNPSPSIRWPVSAKEIMYMNGNMGVLVSGEESESIKSLTRGTVVHASPWRGYGNVAVIEAEGGYRYLYGVCGTLSVRKGDSIESGAELGKLGIYPAFGKPYLVLIVSQNGSPVDPVKAPRS